MILEDLNKATEATEATETTEDTEIIDCADWEYLKDKVTYITRKKKDKWSEVDDFLFIT